MRKKAAGNFLQDLSAFDAFGTTTAISRPGDVPHYTNEYWTSRQRQGHRIHEVSYRACFKPQLPAFFIRRLTGPGDIVLDPFMGRGTTAIEAALLGRLPYGNDANPLSRALAEPRIHPPTQHEVEQRLREIPWADFAGFRHEELLVFYHPQVLAHVEGLRGWLLTREAAGSLDHVDRWIRMVALNRLTGHSPGFFSVYTMPPNQAVSVDRQRKINKKRGEIPPPRDVAAIIGKKSARLLSGNAMPKGKSLLLTGPADHMPEIADATVALTVTSPPFLDIVDYEADNWLRCWFLGIDPKAVNIAQHRDIGAWQAFIAATLRELARVTRPGGHIAFEVGEVRNGRVLLEEQVLTAADGLPLQPLCVLVNRQHFTKTSNCWGVANNRAGTNSNRVVVFRKS